MKLIDRLAIATITLCVGYTEAGLVDYYFDVGLLPRVVAFGFGCACGLVMILGVLIGDIAEQK